MLFLNIIDQTLKVKQCGMAFVAVVKFGSDTEFFQHDYSADTEEILLLDTVLPITPIKLMCYYAVKLRVHVEIGIHKIQIHTAYVDFPHMAVDSAARIRNLHNHRTSVIHNLLNRQLVEVLWLVIRNLLSVNAQRLCEIAKAVKESYSCHRHATI